MSGEVEHRITITFHLAWGEHRADCSCGWVGSYYVAPAEAGREGERHLADQGGQS